MAQLIHTDWKIIYFTDFKTSAQMIILSRFTNRLLVAATVLLSLPLLISAQVTATDDYVHIAVNAQNVRIPVLSNDQPTQSVLKLDKLPLVNHGVAALNYDSSAILFTPEPNYKGVASINYTVTNRQGQYDCGLVTIDISEAIQPNNQTMRLFAQMGKKLTFTVPAGFGQPTAFGTSAAIDPDNNTPGVYHYLPKQKLSTWIFSKPESNGTKYLELTIEAFGTAPSLNLKNDYLNLRIGAAKSLNVLSNDNITKPIRQIRIVSADNPNYTATATNAGLVTVTPAADYKGIANIEYEIEYFDDTKERAMIYCIMANYVPTTDAYTFTAYHNTPYELKYRIPLDSALWSFVLFGQQTTNAGGFVEIQNNQVLYTPPPFGETDFFLLDYCVTGGGCKRVEVNVNLTEPIGDICSKDCVFPGDANRDGVVNMADLITVGGNIGHYGPGRASGNDYLPSTATNWSQTDNGLNIKHADLNGDGFINANDTNVILANYDKYNSIVPEKTPEDTRIELQLVTTTSSAYLGDLLEIRVLVGNADFPAMDSRGLSFTVGYDADRVKDGVMSTEFLRNSWLSRHDTYLALSKTLSLGNIEAALARSRDKGANGHGEVAKIRGIVITDVTGFQAGDKASVRVKVDNVNLYARDGRVLRIKGKELVIPIKVKQDKTEPVKDSDLLMFPNPSSDFVSFYINGVNKIESLRVLDMMGKEVSRQNSVNEKQATVYLDNMTPGMYIAEVMTEKGRITKKLQVAK
jgi:hypothetical protein